MYTSKWIFSKNISIIQAINVFANNLSNTSFNFPSTKLDYMIKCQIHQHDNVLQIVAGVWDGWVGLKAGI